MVLNSAAMQAGKKTRGQQCEADISYDFGCEHSDTVAVPSHSETAVIWAHSTLYLGSVSESLHHITASAKFPRDPRTGWSCA